VLSCTLHIVYRLLTIVDTPADNTPGNSTSILNESFVATSSTTASFIANLLLNTTQWQECLIDVLTVRTAHLAVDVHDVSAGRERVALAHTTLSIVAMLLAGGSDKSSLVLALFADRPLRTLVTHVAHR
jgi:hypothetical protein